MKKLFVLAVILMTGIIISTNTLYLDAAYAQRTVEAQEASSNSTDISVLLEEKGIEEAETTKLSSRSAAQLRAHIDRLAGPGHVAESTCISGDGQATCTCTNECIASADDCVCITFEADEDDK